MKLPDFVKGVRAQFIAKFPVPQGPPSENQEDLVRQWSIKLAEQVRFSTGDPSWGMKRADPGRPISKDTLSKMEGDRLLIWDLFQGTGTGFPVVIGDPDSQDVTGQHFQAVAAIDHLGSGPSPVPGPGSCNCKFTVCDQGPLLEELRAVKVELVLLRSIVSELYSRPFPKPPAYKGPYGLTFRPEGS